jgi:putative hydrolase of the HAD superfamily
VNAILLDAGGVLVWPNWGRVAEALGRQGVVVEATMLARADPYARHALDAAEIIKASTDERRGWQFFNLVLTHVGVPLSEGTEKAIAEMHEYQRVWNLWEHVPAFVHPTLKALRAKGYRLVVVSNCNGTLHAAFERLGLTSLFDVIVDSAREGIEKPDPRLFELALRRAGATADQAVHVGDMYHIDVVGARAAGLSALLVDEANLKAGMNCRCIQSISELPLMM